MAYERENEGTVNKMLTLPIKKQWFDMIAKGEKAEEYREIKPYYRTRFQNIDLLDKDGCASGRYAIIGVRNGYSKNAPTLIVTVILDIGEGETEWGAKEGEVYYILKIAEHHVIIKDGDICYKYK